MPPSFKPEAEFSIDAPPYLANSGDDETMKRLGLATIARAIAEV